MPPKSILPHRHAVDDVLDVVDYYREHAGTPLAENFSLEVDQALERLSHHPSNAISPKVPIRIRHPQAQVDSAPGHHLIS